MHAWPPWPALVVSSVQSPWYHMHMLLPEADALAPQHGRFPPAITSVRSPVSRAFTVFFFFTHLVNIEGVRCGRFMLGHLPVLREYDAVGSC